MKDQRDYLQDLNDIRSMMERSTKFLSLSGLAGVLAGLYALAGAWAAWRWLGFNPQSVRPSVPLTSLPELVALATGVLLLAVGTAVVLSARKAQRRGERVWNPTSRRMILQMSVPLAAGGIFILLLLSRGLVGLAAPASLLFYGLALVNASAYTYADIKGLGLVQVVLGLAGAWFTSCGLLLWAIGFGAAHIVYGLYMHYKYER